MTTWSWIYTWMERTCIVLPQGSEALYTPSFMVSLVVGLICWLVYQGLIILGHFLTNVVVETIYVNIITRWTAFLEMPPWQLQFYSTRGLHLYIFTQHSGCYLTGFFICVFDHKQIPHIQEWVMWTNQKKALAGRDRHRGSRHAGFILVKATTDDFIDWLLLSGWH